MSEQENRVPPHAVILIPAFNEAGVVAEVIGEVIELASLPVVVIDDASTDRTAAEARRAGATVISLPLQLGAWGATQTGLRYARKEGFDIAITMDADGQHKASHIAELVDPVTRGEADVTIGACPSRGSLPRRFAWRLMKHASGLSMDDLTSGYRAYNAKAIKELAHRRATLLDYQDIGVLLLLLSKGARLKDVEVNMPRRRSGGSRVFYSWRMVAYYMIYTLTLGISKRNFRATG